MTPVTPLHMGLNVLIPGKRDFVVIAGRVKLGIEHDQRGNTVLVRLNFRNIIN